MQARRSSSDSNSTGCDRSRCSPYILSARLRSVSSHHEVGRCVGMPMSVEKGLSAEFTARNDGRKGWSRSNDDGRSRSRASARFDAQVAGEDLAAGNETDLDAEILARSGEPGQVEEEGEIESPPGLQAGGISEHPALARLP